MDLALFEEGAMCLILLVGLIQKFSDADGGVNKNIGYDSDTHTQQLQGKAMECRTCAKCPYLAQGHMFTQGRMSFSDCSLRQGAVGTEFARFGSRTPFLR